VDEPLIEYLRSIGATDDDLELVAPNELVALAFIIGLFPDRRRVSVETVARQLGMTNDFVRQVWRAAGFPDPPPGDDALFASDAEVFGGLAASSAFFGEASTLQFLRVLGAAAARIADAAVSLFVTSAAPGAVAQDPSLVELARLNFASADLIPELVAGFEVLLRNHLFAARRFDDTQVVDGIDVQYRSIGFVDMVGSTGLTVGLAPAELNAAFGEFDTTCSDTVVANGGRVVKLIGDEVMYSAPTADSAAATALELVERFANHDVLPPVRAGVATGEVVYREGDYSGALVNLAARTVKIARPSSLLVDRATRNALDTTRYSSRSIGAFSLKGVDQRVPLYRVRPAAAR
jgi:adenylate cyclase